MQVSTSGVATPRHTQACAHINFRIKIMWKVRSKGSYWHVRLLKCGHEASVQIRLERLMVFVAKNGLKKKKKEGTEIPILIPSPNPNPNCNTKP